MAKFSVIIGNPPYQNPGKTKGNKLWPKFIKLSTEIVKDDGYVAMVSPTSWLSGGQNIPKGRFGVFKDIFAKKQLIEATFKDVNKSYFPKIGIKICWWILQNKDIYKDSILNFSEDVLKINLKNIEFLSPEPMLDSVNIVKKTLLTENEKFKTYYFNSQCGVGDNGESEEPTDVNIHPHWIRGSDKAENLNIQFFPKKLNGKVNYKKILLAQRTRYWQPYLAVEDVNVATVGYAIKINEDTTQEGFESVFYSKLFTYLCYNLQINFNGFMKTIFIKKLPYLDMSKVWTDAEIYHHFKLTKAEIQYIEKGLKK